MGHKIKIFTDHKNLTEDALGYTSERVLRWQLLMEEFGPEIEYVKGKCNSVADAISGLDYSGESLHSDTNLYMNELFLQDEDDLALFPMSPKVIAEAQENCTVLKKQLKDKKNKKVYTKRFIHEVELVFLNDKIYIPENLRSNI